MADIQHKRVAQRLKEACEETARQAIDATIASGQASRVHHKNAKFSNRKDAMAAKIAAAKAKREAAASSSGAKARACAAGYTFRLHASPLDEKRNFHRKPRVMVFIQLLLLALHVVSVGKNDAPTWMQAGSGGYAMPTNAVLPTSCSPRRSSSSRHRVARALLSKNWIVKKRHVFATLSELLNPLLCILLFAALKTLEPDLDIPAGWATTAANKTMGTDNTTGSSWDLFSTNDLLADLNMTLSGAGLSGIGSSTTNGSAARTPEELLNATLPLLTGGASSPLSLLMLTSQLRMPRFYFTETTMPGLMLNLALQSLSEGDNLNELSQRDLLLCVVKFMLLGFTSLEPASLYAMPAECQNKIVPYKLAITPDTLYTRQYMAAVLDEWHPRLPLVEPVLGISPLTTPSFRDSRVFFANETALESYLSSEDYGRSLTNPKIYAAIAFQQFPQSNVDIGDPRGHDISFSVRMNSTYTDTNFPNSVPRTVSRRFNLNKYVRSVKSRNTMIYSTRGFLTLQTAVMRVLNCLPAWDKSRQRIVDAGTCQLTQSTMRDDDMQLDDRLLKQLEDDLMLGLLLRVLSGFGGIAQQLLTDPAFLTGTRTGTGTDGDGDATAAIARAIQAINGSSLASPAATIDNIPAATKRALLRVLRQAPQAFHGASVFMSPTEAFHYAGFFDKIVIVFPVGFILSYLYGVSRVIVALLMEKETRSREFMKILGIHDYQIIATWLLTYVELFSVASLLQTLGASQMLFTNSSVVLLFAFFFTFALSSFGFGFLVSTLFSRARAGSFVGMGLFFMMFFVSFSFKDSSSEFSRTLSCVLSPVALAQGIGIVAQLESIGVGLNYANAHDNIGGFRFMAAVYMQLLDFVLYMALGWYLEKVVPKEYGVSEKWYFLVSPSYWRRNSTTLRGGGHTIAAAAAETALVVVDGHHQATEEPVAEELKQQEQDGRAIVISRLRKVFAVPGGSKVAVHALDLALYEGQITCLLGHNGAGKTTLMAMLTGMTPPTSGNATIRGVSIRDGMATIRQSLGYCPQFSVVYPELTVLEHLHFYARVKQHYDNETLTIQDATAVEKMIAEVGLTEKRNVQAHALSGGMKRKLSLAISFLGDNRVVFLDEPTSGMDPYSRRSTWELIQRHKTGKIVILTTHFMDEADLLGDRIAIMAEGELRCVGSSLFLKQRYGVGYRLSFVVNGNSRPSKSETQGQSTNEQLFTDLVKSYVAEATLATDIGTELTFQLPFDASANFPALFEEIDKRKELLGIASYAISVTTLEEIFLKVAETNHTTTTSTKTPATAIERKIESAARGGEELSNPVATSGGSTSSTRETHNAVVWFFIQLRALLLKRLLCAKRDRAMLFYSTLLPIVILFAGLSALRLSLFIKNDPRVQLSTVGQFALGAQTPLPVACLPDDSRGGGSSSWCESTLSFLSVDAVASPLEIEPVVYDNATTPTVFNITYNAPPIAPNDTSGFCLRFAQLAFERGYAKDSETMAFVPNTRPVLGQYGGLVLQATPRDRILAYNLMVNSSAAHGAPTYKALVDQAIHNFLLANGSFTGTTTSSFSVKKIQVATHPFPLSFKTRSIFGSFLSLPAVIFVLIAFTFIPAAMMPFLVKEKQREANARHQQLLSGVSLPAYWLANLVFDLLLYIVPMVVAILLLRFYNISSSLSGSNADAKSCTGCTRDVPQAVVALFALFGTAIAPWTYAMSHVMHDPGACLLYTVMLNFLFGLVLLLTSYSLDSLDSTRAANQVLVFLWRCSPLFSLSNGLLRVIIADIEALFGFASEPQSAFSKDVAGYEIVYLAVQGPVFFLVALGIDLLQSGELTFCGTDLRAVSKASRNHIMALWARAKSCVLGGARGAGQRTRQQQEQEEADTAARQLLLDDEDVRAERARILQPSTCRRRRSTSGENDGSDVVRIAQLSKTYANGKRALSDLTFGLQSGDCFGFLGINGAGKTTTLKILTGDLFPSYGSASLNGFDIVQQRKRVRQSIGYCPQFDALLELLSVREHLELYGRLKGFRSRRLEHEVQHLLAQFQLHAFEYKLAGSLSGGNKRKLSVAIAMLGEPALLFLDEPSTGMDPFSRRFMWDIILHVSVKSRKSTVVLTTHSMEECEALCTRAGIMVGGKLRCFGTIPHLKARFGDGVLVECKLEPSSGEAVDCLMGDLAAQGVLVGSSQRLGTIARAQLAAACTALGSADRIHWILPDLDAEGGGGASATYHPTGAAIFEQLQRNGDTLDAREFCAWWLLEDRVHRLTAFLQTQFGANGSVALLERQLDFCRFKLAPTEPAVALADRSAFSLARLFRVIEGARRELCVKEYSISQTSLEQIFNSFARQQEEEKGVARAFVQ